MNETIDIVKPCGCSAPVLSGIGSIDGVYDARVINDKGKGLPAEFFYIDGNSNKLSQSFFTDNDGNFHWSIENRPLEDIFVNITAGPGYEALVFTPEELIENPIVTLKSVNNSSANSWVVPVLAGGLAVALLAHRNKSIGGVKEFFGKAKNKYQGLSPTTKKVLLIGAGGLTLYLVVTYILKYKPNDQQKKEINAYRNRLLELEAQYGIIPSFADSQYSAWATEIVSAVDDCGTDEGVILRIFERFNNEADVMKLGVIYGVASYKGCFEGSYFGNLHHTLGETLAAESARDVLGPGIFEPNLIERINSILSNKNINFSF